MLYQMLAAFLTAAGIVWVISRLSDWFTQPKGDIALRVTRFLAETLILLMYMIVCLAFLASTAVGAMWLLTR